MSELRIFRPTARTDGYQAPNLFPEFHSRGANHRREYVAECLVEMCRAKTLFLTDVINQPTQIADMAGQVILGHEYISARQHQGRRVPEAIATHRVRLRSLIPGKGITWCRDMVPGELIVKRGSINDDGHPARYRIEEEWAGYKEDVADLLLADAWIALRANGKYCRPAKTQSRQQKEWWFEEVRPEPPAEQAEPPKQQEKRGKAQGTFAPAV